MAQRSTAPFSARSERLTPAAAISVRLTDAERALVDAAAARCNMTRSEYVRLAIGAAITEAIKTGRSGV